MHAYSYKTEQKIETALHLYTLHNNNNNKYQNDIAIV